MDRLQRAFGQIHATEELKIAALGCLARRRRAGASLAAACALLVLAVGLGSFRLVLTPVSYISVDVNPSIELSLNRFDRVVAAQAYNQDGALVLENLTLEGKPYVEAVELVLKSDAMVRCLTEEAELTFTVAAASQEQETAIVSGLQSCAGYREYNAQSFCVSQDTLRQAHSFGLSFGKYHAYCTLAQYDSSITPEQCREMTMAELHRCIRQGAAEQDAGRHGRKHGQT